MLDSLKQAFKKRRHGKAVQRAASGPGSVVLVYQMGKVGSSSVQASLKAVKGMKSFQVHRLERGFLDAAAAGYRQKGLPVPRRLEQSLLLRERIIEPRHPAKVISLVREPIGRNMSAYFENLDRLWGIEKAHRHLTLDQLMAGFFEKFPQNSVLDWFDDEFGKVLGIDIYQTPFPHEERMVQITRPPYDALIMRIDLDDEKKAACLKRFLGIQKLPWITRNASDDTGYGEVYREFKKNIRLPTSYIDEMLNSRFTRHFFSEQEIALLNRKWLGSAS